MGLTWPLPFLLRPLDARFLTMIAVVGDYDFEEIQKVRDVVEFLVWALRLELWIRSHDLWVISRNARPHTQNLNFSTPS